MSDLLQQLSNLLAQRKLNGDPANSYVAQLHHQGLNKILEKVGEECVETLIAAKDTAYGGAREALIGETADLWFHTLVMLSHLDIDVDAILEELARRQDLSGIEEKARRQQ